MAGSAGAATEEVGRATGRLAARIFLVTFPALALLAGALGALLIATTSRISWVALPGLVGVAAALSAVHARSEVAGYPVRIRMTPAALSLSYPKFEIEAPWEDWTPFGRSRMTSGVALRARWGSPRGYLVTPEQATQIWRHPSHPDWPGLEGLFPKVEPRTPPAAPPPRPPAG